MYKDNKSVSTYFSNNTLRENALPLMEKIFETSLDKKKTNEKEVSCNLLHVPARHVISNLKPGPRIMRGSDMWINEMAEEEGEVDVEA
jgi:hypothetical protein